MNAEDAFNEAVRNQRIAADPDRSAFVSANAGAGKTRVLTDRVARLLLTGVPPQRILCITYTKAAAAEMATRLFELLGDWSLKNDSDLNAALDALDGGRPRDADDLSAARRLFARALETPGGLKIQTIHSFCESVLKRFPLEAGAPPGFSVLEDASAIARDCVRRAVLNPKCADAWRRLVASRNAKTVEDALFDSLLSRQRLEHALEHVGGWEQLRALLRERLLVGPSDTPEAARAEALNAFPAPLIARAFEVNRKGAKTQAELAQDLLHPLTEGPDAARAYALMEAFFLTGEKTPRKRLSDKQTQKIDPALKDLLHDAQTAFVEARERLCAIACAIATEDFYALLEVATEDFSAQKAARAALDYDDLIISTRRLLGDEAMNAWVRYKLDQGLDHILLDEAQDTGPDLWRIIEAPLADSFAGDGARETPRTFFAVGDQKQSIYSFMGADAALFSEKREDLGKRLAQADRNYADVPLALSFRTVAPVLRFVDRAFAPSHAREGLVGSRDDDLRHTVRRAGEAGLVELWPAAPKLEKEDPRPWDAPVDATRPDSPAVLLTRKVAQTISQWIETGERLESVDAPITAGDILILVQSRGPAFRQIIAALEAEGVPVAGPDRINLQQDIGVLDLMSAAKAALSEQDDLSLAEALKSPFFDIDEGALLDLAHGREGTLWSALCEKAKSNGRFAAIVFELRILRRLAKSAGPYAFFSTLLETSSASDENNAAAGKALKDHATTLAPGIGNGRQRLYRRLGPGAADGVNEILTQALIFERTNPRSLEAFIPWAANHLTEIKRDAEQAADAVRIMTVHGAKGLEAPIVFLIDAERKPNTGAPAVLSLAPAPGAAGLAAPVITPPRDLEPDQVADARAQIEDAAWDEYRRLFYVATTRARDRLYICSGPPKSDKRPDEANRLTWRELAEDAFNSFDDALLEPFDAWPGEARRITCPQTTHVAEAKPHLPTEDFDPPTWLKERPEAETPLRRIAPSRIAETIESQTALDEIVAKDGVSYSPSRPEAARRRGIAIHRALELLIDVPDDRREAAAQGLLKTIAHDARAEDRDRWAEETLRVLRSEEFAAAFGPDSISEAPIAGRPPGAAANVLITGQIDRLSVLPDRVLAIDFKTNRPPPKNVEDTPPAYLAQMAAYRALLREIFPKRPISTAILWTYEARLTPLPDALLDHAFARAFA
ncbi:MAG: double-strand break repair helicase AddA [Pseudomonadota bacterium]